MNIETLIQFNPWWREKTVPKIFLGSYQRPGLKIAKQYLAKRFIILLYGLRRTGKTTILYQLIQHCLDIGIEPNHIFYFSFDEQSASLHQLILIYQEKILKNKISENNKHYYFFLDEIQKAADWQNQIKLIYDLHPNLKIFLSGSSSLSLQKKATESLAGRIIDIFIKPLEFHEFLEWKNVEIDFQRPELYQGIAQPLLMDYLRKGGFPEIIKEDNDDLIKTYLKNTVLERIIYRDLPPEFGFKDVELLRTLIELFAKQPGMLVNIERLSRDLRRNKITIANYLEYLKYGFLIREVKNLRPGFLITSRKGKKIYPTTSALCFVYQPDFYSEINLQKIAETAVAEFINAEYYYRNNFEVDFIQKNNEQIMPIEVKYGAVDLNQVLKFLKKFRLSRGILVSKDTLKTFNGIKAMPLWLFLLAQPL